MSVFHNHTTISEYNLLLNLAKSEARIWTIYPKFVASKRYRITEDRQNHLFIVLVDRIESDFKFGRAVDRWRYFWLSLKTSLRGVYGVRVGIALNANEGCASARSITTPG